MTAFSVEDVEDAGSDDDSVASSTANTDLQELMAITVAPEKYAASSTGSSSSLAMPEDPKLQRIIAKIQKKKDEAENETTKGSRNSKDQLQAIVDKIKAVADNEASTSSTSFFPSSQYKPKKKKQPAAEAPKKGKKKPQEVANTKPKREAKNKVSPAKNYKPGEFQEARKAFLAKAKSRGWSHKDACAQWMLSNKRANLLESMPYAELKRRRFL